jgi:hypothetical protein
MSLKTLTKLGAGNHLSNHPSTRSTRSCFLPEVLKFLLSRNALRMGIWNCVFLYKRYKLVKFVRVIEKSIFSSVIWPIGKPPYKPLLHSPSLHITGTGYNSSKEEKTKEERLTLSRVWFS